METRLWRHGTRGAVSAAGLIVLRRRVTRRRAPEAKHAGLGTPMRRATRMSEGVVRFRATHSLANSGPAVQDSPSRANAWRNGEPPREASRTSASCPRCEMDASSLLTSRALRHERMGAPLGIFAAALLLGALWTVWLFFGSIARYAITDARLEVEGQAHPVVAQMNGTVVASYMTLGETVVRGQVLAELESVDMQFDLVNLQARRAGLVRQIESTRQEMDARNQALRDTRRSVPPTLAEASARLQEAEIAANLAERRAARVRTQHDSSFISEAFWDSVTSTARQKRAMATAIRATLGHIRADGQLQQSEQSARVAALAREQGRLESELASVEASSAHVEHERQHSFIVAPTDGRLGEAVPLQPGSTVHDGDRLGAVIPPGLLRAIATFPAEQAIGRIRPGQRARLRIKSLPWVQYGTLMARVTHLASEGAQGNVRVELAVQDADRFPALLEHGLAATLEVEVERVRPIVLVLRSVGQRLDRPIVEPSQALVGGTTR